VAVGKTHVTPLEGAAILPTKASLPDEQEATNVPAVEATLQGSLTSQERPAVKDQLPQLERAHRNGRTLCSPFLPHMDLVTRLEIEHRSCTAEPENN